MSEDKKPLLTLTMRFEKGMWSTTRNWGTKLPQPVVGEPYTIILDEQWTSESDPLDHSAFGSVTGYRTKPVTRIFYAGERRVVFEAGDSHFGFQLTDGTASREYNFNEAFARLDEMRARSV